MRTVVSLACAVMLAAGAATAQEPTDGTQQTPPLRYVEKEMWAPAPGAFPNGLDVLEVYADRPGQHPLVVLTHGTSNDEQERMHVTPWSQLGQALWFARRGYVAFVVVRKGYGRSGGERDSSKGGCRARNGSFEEAGEASAEDLKAVIRFAQKLPEVDGSTVVSAGVSTGGFAQAALVADPPKELKAGISFAGGRGGDGHEHNCDADGVIAAYAAFGKGARKHGQVPMLWIYSENDHWFPPPMARKFEAAYVKGGGVEQFVQAPPDGDDGHHLYRNPGAWSATVEAFLREHNLLPLGDVVLPGPEPPKVPAPAGLTGPGQEAWRRYLLGGPFKSFATNGQGQWGFAQAAFDQSIADNEAMDRCKQAAAGAGSCAITSRTPEVK
ncbi:MAG TPA: CocE/NonD family hydrolase [Verrucomicrobiae bacterium]|nr:CocE/NonD family hydrolase [Verrucomicrobiae bacterium]